MASAQMTAARSSQTIMTRGRGRPPSSFPGRREALLKLRLGSGPLSAEEWRWILPQRRAEAAEVKPRTLQAVGLLVGLTRERVRQLITRSEHRPAEMARLPHIVQQVRRLFRRSGYVRRQDPARLATEGYMEYKKGDELRLVARSAAELRHIRLLLRQAGFKPGRAFAKGRQWRQPLYGRATVARFLALIGET